MEGLVVLLMVDTHDKHGSISAGCRDDDSLGTTLQVSLKGCVEIQLNLCPFVANCRSHITGRKVIRQCYMLKNTYRGLLNGGEYTSGLNHILGTSITPFDVGGVPPAKRGREEGLESQ